MGMMNAVLRCGTPLKPSSLKGISKSMSRSLQLQGRCVSVRGLAQLRKQCSMDRRWLALLKLNGRQGYRREAPTDRSASHRRASKESHPKSRSQISCVTRLTKDWYILLICTPGAHSSAPRWPQALGPRWRLQLRPQSTRSGPRPRALLRCSRSRCSSSSSSGSYADRRPVSSVWTLSITSV